MEILDKTEIRNKEEDEDMRKIHTICDKCVHSRYYREAFWSYHRRTYWNTEVYKEDREIIEQQREEREYLKNTQDLHEMLENNDITEKQYHEAIAELDGKLPEGSSGLIEEIEVEEEELPMDDRHIFGVNWPGRITEDDWNVEDAAIYEKAPECYCCCDENKYICLYTPCCDKKMHLVCMYVAMSKPITLEWKTRKETNHCPYCRGCWEEYENTLFPPQ